MLSKFLRASSRFPYTSQKLLINRPSTVMLVRYSLIPPSQYDTPYPDKFKPGYVIKNYWETIPLFTCTLFAFACLFGAILWALRNKVDVVYQTHSRENISRTMDLRNPSVHKIVIINQKYEPWPEMQDVLDKMRQAERRALVRAQACSLA